MLKDIWFPHTMIDGVVELGQIVPFHLELPRKKYYGEYFGTIPAVENFIKFMGWNCADRNHWWNPQLANSIFKRRDLDTFGPNHWHTDTDSGRDFGPNMIMMIACQNMNAGTLFSGPATKPCYTRFQAIPWRVYWVRGDMMHRSPDIASDIPRVCFRWYQSDKIVDDNSRRDEDGNLTYENFAG